MDAFIANLRHAIRNRETVIIGGGEFTHEELKEILGNIEELRQSYNEAAK